MRMLHTSDWHLGRQFGQVSLADEHESFVAWMLDVVHQERIDLVVVAGDVYDRAIPPVESVTLLRQALTTLAGSGVRVVAIAGNHDSAERVAASDGLTDAAGIFIRGGYGRVGDVITLPFADGPLDVVAVPYLDPLMAPPSTVGDGETAPDGAARRPTHQTVLRQALSHPRPLGASRSVAVAHAFVAGATETDSERALTVGDTGRVATTTFDGFSYVALGRLHRPQVVGGDPTRRYCGSPLPFSFSETHAKEVVVVDLDAAGRATITSLPVPVGRPVATITGGIDELLMHPRHTDVEQHFVRAVVTDSGPVLDAKARLLHRYPYVTEIVLPTPSGRRAGHDGDVVRARTALAPIDATTAFWGDVTGAEPTDVERRLLESLLAAALSDEAAR
ncbi:exonuclease SbcCD subunit D [soil metagenome]